MTIATELNEARWSKSSYSQGNGNCVEVAYLDGGGVAIRDSKDPSGPALLFTAGEWDAFSAGMTDGEFVRP